MAVAPDPPSWSVSTGASSTSTGGTSSPGAGATSPSGGLSIVLAGASGFIGGYLTDRFTKAGHRVLRVGRVGPDARWDDAASLAAVVDGAGMVINLAGRSVNCRYNDANRREIFASRIDTTRALARAIREAATPPPLWINSSTATIYRHADDRPMTESTGELGHGFSAEVARSWEAAFFEGELPATRRVALRTAIVLGQGSVMTPFIALARFGLGGPQRDGRWPSTRARRASGTFHALATRAGRQRFSWIHIHDLQRVIEFVAAHPELNGVINASAPAPVANRVFMREVRARFAVPFGVPTFRWMLELGSFAIRTESELVLKSRWVLPERLTAVGFRFEFPEIDGALRDIMR